MRLRPLVIPGPDCVPDFAKKGEALLAAASCAASDSRSGPSASMRSRVKRTDGPAMLMLPIGGWPARRTGAAMALSPAV